MSVDLRFKEIKIVVIEGAFSRELVLQSNGSREEVV